MIIKKTWIKRKPIFKHSSIKNVYYYTGWFLFGIIPLYINRVRIN